MASGGVAAPTFKECAERYIEDNWMRWSKQHRAQWPSSMERYALPDIANLPPRLPSSSAVLSSPESNP
jgi:hypothetical protein